MILRKNILKGIFILVFLSPFIYAQCENGQIDINEADLEELDKLIGVGPATAENIINTRPFESIDDLIKVYGIGQVKLSNIKNQGLACVEDSKKEQVKEEIKEDVEIEFEEAPLEERKPKEPVVFETIKLTAQTIKSETNIESNKSKLPLFGLIGFAFLLAGLFALKRRKYKNEFG